MNDTEAIISGKNLERGIVAIEIEDDVAIIYEQDLDTGLISRREEGNRYWVLSPTALDNRFKCLDGSLHYQYGALVKSKKEFYEIKNRYRNADLYSVSDPREQHMIRYGRTLFKGLKHDQVSVLAFDIETTGLNHDEDSKVLLIANTFRDSKGTITRRLFSYDEYESPKEMLEAWCTWVCKCDPSIMCGHNIFGFDLRYLDFIAQQNGTELTLGREGQPIKFASYESRFRKDGSQTIGYNKVSVHGRHFFDTFFTTIKWDILRNLTSYALKSIIKELGREVDGRVFYDASKIKDNYLDPKEFDLIKNYCIFDGDDALGLYDLTTPSLFYLAQITPKTYQQLHESASGSQINSIMVRSYLQNGHSIPKPSLLVPFKGAISACVPGIYRHSVRWDVAGLYPSIMRQYKVYNKEKDPKGNLLVLTEYLTIERMKNKKLAKETKLKYYDDLQNSQKVTANSLYGFLSTNGINFNYPSGASFITQKGREILMSAVEHVTGDKFENWSGAKTDE